MYERDEFRGADVLRDTRNLGLSLDPSFVLFGFGDTLHIHYHVSSIRFHLRYGLISPRTVGHHLTSVYPTLGITSPAELARIDFGGELRLS